MGRPPLRLGRPLGRPQAPFQPSHENRYPFTNWSTFAPPKWSKFTPPLTVSRLLVGIYALEDNSDWVAFDQDLFDRKKSPDYDPEEYTLVGYVEAAEKGRVELVVGDYGVFELVTPTGRYRAHAVLNEEAGDGFVVKLVGHWFSTGEELEVITGGTPTGESRDP